MAARFSSLSRSLLTTAARSASLRSPPPTAASRLRPPTHRRRLSSAPLRSLGELGCTQSFLPFNALAMPRLTAHLSAQVRACCELSHGTFRRTCQDR